MWITKCYFSLLCGVVFLIASQNNLHGQDLGEHQPGAWFVLSGNTKIHEHWSIPTAAIVKNNSIWENYGFSLLQTGLSFKPTPSSTFTGGLAYLNMNSYENLHAPKNSSQIWFYASFSLKTTLRKDILDQRWRLENCRPIHTDGAKMKNRFRYRLQYRRPIHKNVYLKCYDEIILNLEGESFNQNRFFIGMGQKLTPSLCMDIGYLNRQLSKSREDMVQIGFSFSLDLTKDEHASMASVSP